MSTARRTVLIRRSVEEVAKLTTDPDVILPIMGGFGRFSHIADNPDGSQRWELFISVGTIHVGGQVLIEAPSNDALQWRSLRGTRHTARIEVAPDPVGAAVTMSVSTEFAGALTGRLTGILARGILNRYIDAALEQLRHHIEYGE